jgi:hypothetical protein
VSQEDEQPAGRRCDADRPAPPADNSLGRLLTLSDGIFAISMTLLALSLQVPNLGGNPSDASLRHALAANADSYWSFLLTFYVVANYWKRHRRLMRSVVTTHPALIRDTLALLLFVAAMPFPASLLRAGPQGPVRAFAPWRPGRSGLDTTPGALPANRTREIVADVERLLEQPESFCSGFEVGPELGEHA